MAETILGCRNLAAAAASRRKRITAARSRLKDGGSSLSATTRSRCRWRALSTRPIPPAADLLQHNVIADQEPLRLALANGGCLIRRELAETGPVRRRDDPPPAVHRRERSSPTMPEPRPPAPIASGSGCQQTGRCRRRHPAPPEFPHSPREKHRRSARTRSVSESFHVYSERSLGGGSARSPLIGSRLGDSLDDIKAIHCPAYRRLAATASRAALATFAAVSPYFSIKASGAPLSPNWSPRLT